MANFPQPCPQQYFDSDQFPGNSSPRAGASWTRSTAASTVPPQHPQSTPSSNCHPLPGQPWGNAGVLRDDMFPSTNVAGNRQVDRDEDWEEMRPSVENPAARDQLQDIQRHDHIIHDYARVAQDVPIQADVAPPVPQVAAGPASAFFDEVPHQEPVPNGRASEVLRQLALLYLNDPNSQLVTIRMGPGHGSEVTVDITLKLTNL